MPVQHVRSASPGERAAAVAEACRVIEGGALAVLPSETVYVLAASAGESGAVERFLAARARLWGERGGARGAGGDESSAAGTAAWHPTRAVSGTEGIGLAGAVTPLEELLALNSRAHRRLLRRLAPGPVIFRVERDARFIDALRRQIGGADVEVGVRGKAGAAGGTRRVGAFDDGETVAVRVSSDPTLSAVVETAGVPVVVDEIPLEGGAGGGAGGWAREAAGAAGALSDAGVEAGILLDDGPSLLGKPATVVRLRASGRGGGEEGGGFTIERAGAYEERFIRKQLERTVLFVCTGNTCRSPMAAAIAMDLLEREGEKEEGVRTRVLSAGTGVGGEGGGGMTPEAVRALRELSVRPTERGGRSLDRRLIAEADVIFGVTASHVRSVLAQDASAAWKTRTLDPSGADVPDPIGLSQKVYSDTAARLRELIAGRLRELDG